jgi:hypothetical protein
VDAPVSGGAPAVPGGEPLPAEQLVAVRPDVLGDAEHALGNLFQRVYHVTRLAREGLGAHADRLTEALESIEHLLELVFDYVSPVEIELRPLGAAKVAESLAAQLRGHGVRLETGECPPLRVLGDPRVLGRAFHLLVRAFGRDWEKASRVAFEVVHDAEAERVQFTVRAEASEPSVTPADANLALAVAGRLIDLQGGDLITAAGAESHLCSVALAVSTENHGAV